MTAGAMLDEYREAKSLMDRWPAMNFNWQSQLPPVVKQMVVKCLLPEKTIEMLTDRQLLTEGPELKDRLEVLFRIMAS